MKSLWCVVVWIVAVTAAPTWADPFTDGVRARCEAALLAGVGAGGVEGACEDARLTADYAAGWASARQLGAVGWSEGTLRVLGAASEAGLGLGELGKHPELCVELGLLLREQDDAAAALALAGRLATDRGGAVDRYPGLAAAVCVVHEKGYSRRINENTARAPDAVAVFDYFVRNASRLQLDPAATPALLLVHVVDVTERIDQLEWALRTYGDHPRPGERFFEIEYDTDHFRHGRPKKVTGAGDYRLESIKRHGGVCADQAYFAESVGKACGVPTCYVVAKGADVSHAWIGYLETRGRTGAWDFSRGRYEAYQNLRGHVLSPQTGRRLSDAEVGLLGGLLSCSAAEVRATMGAAIAARRMMSGGWEAPGALDGVDTRGTLRAARAGTAGDGLGLVRLAMTACAAVPDAWGVVTAAAEAKRLDAGELDVWARAVERMCGDVFPDFSFDTVAALIDAEKDPRAKHRMWEWAFTRYRARPDLASAVRFEQGRAWEAAGRPETAWAAYEDVVRTFLNDGPMGVEALRAMRAVLEKNGKAGAILPYLEDAAGRVQAPGSMGGSFRSQSNHYKVHAMLAEELDRAGRSAEAARVRERAGVRKSST